MRKLLIIAALALTTSVSAQTFTITQGGGFGGICSTEYGQKTQQCINEVKKFQQDNAEQQAIWQLKQEGYIDDVVIAQALAENISYSHIIKIASAYRTARTDFIRNNPNVPFDCKQSNDSFTCFATK